MCILRCVCMYILDRHHRYEAADQHRIIEIEIMKSNQPL